MKAPFKVVRLYIQTLANADMDSGTYVGGTDVYQADRVIAEVARLAGWTLPDVTCDMVKDYLTETGQEEYIELLGVNGLC